MDCGATRSLIDEYLDEMLNPVEGVEFRTHITVCRECRHRLQRELDFREGLRSLRAPTPDPEFEAQAFRYAEIVCTSGRRVSALVIVKIAASILIVFALGYLFNGLWKPGQPEGLDVSIRLNQPEEIKLVFHSGEDLKDVTFSLIPPDGIEPVGFEGRREIVWQGNLEPGDNLLVIPVIARNRRGGTLTVAIRSGDRIRKFHLRLRVKQPENPKTGMEGFRERRLSIESI